MENDPQTRGIQIFLRMKPLLQPDMTTHFRPPRDALEVSVTKAQSKMTSSTTMGVTPSKRPMKTTENRPPIDLSLDDLRMFKKEDNNRVIDLKSKRMFDFDHVFDDNSVNKDVFDLVFKDGFDFVFENKKVAILMYGQTASGKTHTMKGRDMLDGTLAQKSSKDLKNQDELEGLVQLTLRKAIKALQASKGTKFNLKVSYMELYNEEIYDLLEPAVTGEKKRLKIMSDDQGNTVVEGLSQFHFSTLEEGLALFEKGEKNRKFAYTRQNHNSSRSHVFLEISIETRRPNSDYKTITSKLILADLAGSEKYCEGNETETRAEAKDINKSLLALSRVITQLNTKSDYSLFRESKLTRILQPYLTGNSRTVIVCTISLLEKNFAESLTTLTFGMTAKGIKFAVKKEVPAPPDAIPTPQEVIDLRNELMEKDSKLCRLEAEREDLTADLARLRDDYQDLQFQKDIYEEKMAFYLNEVALLKKINEQHQQVNERINRDLDLIRHRLDSERKSIHKLAKLNEDRPSENQASSGSSPDSLEFENLKELNRQLKSDVDHLKEELRVQKLVNQGLKPLFPKLENNHEGTNNHSGIKPRVPFLLDIKYPDEDERRRKRIDNQLSYEDLLKDRDRLKAKVDTLERDEKRAQKRENELKNRLEDKCAKIAELQRQFELRPVKGFGFDYE